MLSPVAAPGPTPIAPSPPLSPVANTVCSDIYPYTDGYTCAQQAVWGQCTQPWLQYPYCQQSCGRCTPAASPVASPSSPTSCTDIYPYSDGFTCAQQAGYGQCGQSWLQAPYCMLSCGRCNTPVASPVTPPTTPTTCTDVYPYNDGYTCAQQAGYGQCGQSWLQAPYCMLSCGRCNTPVAAPVSPPTTCTDVYPYNDGYTCAQQAGYGQCGQSWLQAPYCMKSCGRCTGGSTPVTLPTPVALPNPNPTSTPVTPCTNTYPYTDGYTCAQQAAWGKCTEPWMQAPVCNHSCGRC